MPDCSDQSANNSALIKRAIHYKSIDTWRHIELIHNETRSSFIRSSPVSKPGIRFKKSIADTSLDWLTHH